MKKLVLIILVLYAAKSNEQTHKSTYNPNALKYSGTKRTAVKPASRNTADTLLPLNNGNIFPAMGNSGIGTSAPQAPLEIRRNAGDTRKKNVLLQLSNEWAANGQNEPSILFSNGDMSSVENVSYWTIGARVSGDQKLNTPLTFKISHKPIGSNIEQEYFSIDSYQGRVKIGDVNTKVDGYKLYVEQGILTEKVKVAVKNSDDWFDHVLKQDYNLMSLYDLKTFINANHHLPDIPTTEEVMKDGIDLGKMNGLLLKKIEELTKYVIDIKTELDQTKKELEETKKAINKKD